jgi:hypothetical protein
MWASHGRVDRNDREGGAMQALILAQNGAGEISFTPDLTGFVSLAAGILIFAVPRALNYIVAAYLVVVGLILLFNVRI